MNYVEILVLALLLDALIGEPDLIWSRTPHPTVLMGRAVDFIDQKLNNGAIRTIKGAAGVLAICTVAGLVGTALAMLPGHNIWELIIAVVFIAHRSLIDHVRAVAQGLSLDLGVGRQKVGLIVGRDTGDMDESAVSRAAIESTAENFSDGVVAPVFWFLLFGAPGIMIYKAVNTADSMIGHKTEEYIEFGRFAARLDDVLNWIPARITAWLYCMVGRKSGAWAATKEDAVFHRSPNAGWPEAAMAHTLGIALAGPRSYGGTPTIDPFLNGAGRRELTAADIKRAVRLTWMAWAVLMLIFVALAFILHIA